MQQLSYARLRVDYWIGHMEVPGNNTVGHFGGRADIEPCPECVQEGTEEEVATATRDNSITEFSEKGIRDDGQYPEGKSGQREVLCK